MRLAKWAPWWVVWLGGAMAALGGFALEVLGPQSTSPDARAEKYTAGTIMLLGVIMLIVGVLLTIQRCHDFDVSGWLSLLLIVPIAPLVFWIIPGTKGPNRFGNPTPPNSTGVVVLALILPILFFVGIIAAIAIPAYQDYVQRARMTEDLRQQEQLPDQAMEEAGAGDGLDEGSGDEPAQAGADQPAESD